MLVYGRASTKARMAWNEAIFMIFLRWFSGVHSRHRPPLVMNSSGKFSWSAWPPQGLVTKTFLFYWFSRIVVKGLNVLNAQLSCVSVLLTVSWDCCRDPRRPLRPVDGVLGLLQSCWLTSLQPSQAILILTLQPWPCNRVKRFRFWPCGLMHTGASALLTAGDLLVGPPWMGLLASCIGLFDFLGSSRHLSLLGIRHLSFLDN